MSPHVKIIDFRGEKTEYYHMVDYKYIDMFYRTECHPKSILHTQIRLKYIFLTIKIDFAVKIIDFTGENGNQLYV